MTQQRTQHRRAAVLLLAAAALPFTPALAQSVSPDTPPPVVAPPPPIADVPATGSTPPPVEAPSPALVPAPTMAPIVHTPPPANEAAAPRRAPVRARTPRTTRAAAPSPAAAPSAETTPAPLPAGQAEPIALTPVPEPVAQPDAAAAPASVSEPPAIATERSDDGAAILWSGLLALGALMLGLATYLLIRRRRRDRALHYEESYDPAPQFEPAADYSEMPAKDFAVAAAATRSVGPELQFLMRPVRAGVTGDDAHVEFELTVDNRGSAPAHDVRVSTWMFPAGTPRGTEMERMLIQGKSEVELTDVDAGETRQIERAHTLSTVAIDKDSVLPVVAAEARYRTDDGIERRTSARFAVGVPIDGELAHFDLDNPSGMHDDVEARPIEEMPA
ncbi:MAG TPA: hypothetical protein VJR87_08310 [Allosphingosinicella sp.]|nr:hypothetical protein [Allosphingosinicella sp.]